MYGMEAIIIIEIEMPTLRIGILEEANSEPVPNDLDMAEELREAAVVHIASYQQRLENLYNMQVKPRTFQDGDLSLEKSLQKHG